jgi:hypothetical protein
MATNPYFNYSMPDYGNAVSKMEVDARVRGGLMTMCEFAGHEFSPDKARKCKFYDKSKRRTCCLYYVSGVGACQYWKEGE